MEKSTYEFRLVVMPSKYCIKPKNFVLESNSVGNKPENIMLGNYPVRIRPERRVFIVLGPTFSRECVSFTNAVLENM